MGVSERVIERIRWYRSQSFLPQLPLPDIDKQLIKDIKELEER